MSDDTELRGIASAPPAPEWLRTLIRGIGREGVKVNDPRVKQLWDLLRSRGLLIRSPWLKLRLRYIWGKGLAVRHRPKTVRRVKLLLRHWGILPAAVTQVTVPVQSTLVRAGLRPFRRLRPVRVRRVARLRPVVRSARRR